MLVINSKNNGYAFAKNNTTYYNVQLGLPGNGSAIDELVVCNSWDVFALGPAVKRGDLFFSGKRR